MNSTSSLQESPTDHQQHLEHELGEELKIDAGVTRLGKMSAIKSNSRNLKIEDDAVRQDVEDHRRALGMGETSLNPGPRTVAEDGEGQVDIGEIMAARDVQIHYHDPQKPKSQEVQPAVAPIAPTPRPPNGMNPTIRNLLTAAGIIGAGGAGSAATYFLTRPEPSIVAPENPGRDTTITVEGH